MRRPNARTNRASGKLRTHILRDGTPFRTSRPAKNVFRFSFPDGAPFRVGLATLKRCGTSEQRDAVVIGCLREMRDWNVSPDVGEFFKRKVEQSDRAFFIKLGRALSEKNRKKRKGGFSLQQQILLVCWDELQHFSIEAATEFIHLMTGERISPDAFVKMRDRLNLKLVRPVLVRQVKLRDGVIELHQKRQKL